MEAARDAGGVIFNIQRYSIHDGPGIRTTVFLKGCPLNCFWCQNPESQKRRPEIFFNAENCTGCGRCAAICPNRAASVSDGKAHIDRSLCRGCGQCVAVCPNAARTLIGKHATVHEVMAEVTRDRRYYEKSGGGVTLSGGDPTAQPRFALALLTACKDAGLHTAIETCGYTSWPVMEKLLQFTDLVLYDIKCLDDAKHLSATGKPNRRILENAARIAAFRPVRLRVPVIPGFNDRDDDMRAMAAYAARLGCTRIDLMPYNKMGESKYARLDRSFTTLDSLDEDRLQALKRIVDDA